ncbi:hypothetical protein [Myxococcus sp. RHSTA-1-4]|uniref:hypothetical protein n=1 Tax=Myxococcus sp. RHSTA-1-4 TaxID=2874601 RepID=UPI001CBFE007|nr:hypothetical protein [Myxococcus sp. RHSTA-1-4]MBZ4419168.1 hypothetical protein [Myxococcus sp. RHSTA-1-4]
MRAPVLPTVVDTNVPLTANKTDDPSPGCVLACVQALQSVMTGHLVLDEHWHIINEYRHKLSSDGQPGIGDRFLKWVLTNHANPQRCSKVRLTPRQEDPRDFEEFPRDESLAGFDPSDRKFVAVSCAHPERPVILQATDSKWWGLREALHQSGVQVRFLCPKDIEQIHERKGGQ